MAAVPSTRAPAPRKTRVTTPSNVVRTSTRPSVPAASRTAADSASTSARAASARAVASSTSFLETMPREARSFARARALWAAMSAALTRASAAPASLAAARGARSSTTATTVPRARRSPSWTRVSRTRPGICEAMGRSPPGGGRDAPAEDELLLDGAAGGGDAVYLHGILVLFAFGGLLGAAGQGEARAAGSGPPGRGGRVGGWARGADGSGCDGRWGAGRGRCVWNGAGGRIRDGVPLGWR